MYMIWNTKRKAWLAYQGRNRTYISLVELACRFTSRDAAYAICNADEEVINESDITGIKRRA